MITITISNYSANWKFKNNHFSREEYEMRCGKSFFLLLMVSFTIFYCLFQNNIVESTSSFSTTYFPTDEWRKSSPEEVEMNSSKLENLYQVIISQDIGIDSIHIVRHGYLVYEKYFDYYNYSNLHHLWSSTKSITSILIGIANATGFITDLDEPVLDIFSDRSFTNIDARKEALTIRHLLKMQSGLQWNEHDVQAWTGTVNKHDYEFISNLTDVSLSTWPFNPIWDPIQMINSSDWIQFVLDRPMLSDPGTEVYYNSGVSHLLSAIIQNKTGMNTERFAKQYLFDPLDIGEYLWFNDSLGISIGGFGLWLQPFDLTKIGYLYLNNGTWNDSQIVPAQWVQESTQDYGIGYGYHWYIDTSQNFYYSPGLGGQIIVIKPDDSLVVAITASEYEFGVERVLFFLENFILKSIVMETTDSTSDDQSTTTTPSFTCVIVFLSIGLVILTRKKRG